MSLVLGCIADDYTGASDLANTLKKAGLRTVQTIGVPDRDYRLPDVDAVVLSLKSRSIDPAQAVSLSLASYDWLKAQGAQHILFKICSTFDSTDRGNIGPVMDALLEKTGDDCIIVTPAFPETKRTIYMGNLFVGHVPLNESPLKDHPLNPMHDSNLVRVLQRQSRHQIGLADLSIITKGRDALRARLKECGRDGVRAVVVDTVFDADLEPIGEVAADAGLSVGASGLGLGLATAFVRRGAGGGQVAGLPALAPSPAACLAGSCSQATLGQVAAAEKIMPVFRMEPDALMERRAAYLDEITSWASERLAAGPVLVASTATPDRVRALQSRFGQSEIGHAIEQAMADLAERLVAQGVRRLVVAGGETSGAVVDRLGVPGFVVGPEIAAGVPVLGTSGYRHDMRIALKSGNFGGPDFFADALKLMP
jgi:3-dehydrotetronate 4-kinase